MNTIAQILCLFSLFTKSFYLSIKSIFIVCIFIFTSINISAQNNIIYPYGGKELSQKPGLCGKPPLRFNLSLNLNEKSFAEVANFCEAHFENSVFFRNTTFKDSSLFKNVKFDNVAYFSNAYFHKYVDFVYTTFANTASFHSAHFNNNSDFHSCKFKGFTSFFKAEFAGEVNFDYSNFSSNIDFRYAKFNLGLTLRQTRFDEKLELDGTIIRGTLDLRGSQFLNGIDLRKTYLDSLKKIYIDHTTFFPEGKFWVRWDQLLKRLCIDNQDLDSILVSSNQNLDSIRQNNYRSLEIFYQRLRDNYLVQRDNVSADNVMFDLGKQRAEILKEFHWRLYGWLFGWGYQPWKFLFFVVLPIILLFTLIWYWFYFELVVRMVNDRIDKEFSSDVNKLGMAIKKIPLFQFRKIISKSTFISVYDHSNSSLGLSRLSKYWHVLSFSASVLLDIRFKDQWLKKVEAKNKLGEKTFLTMITFEWILGIGLYIGFALLVSSSRFDFIKELLGF